MICGCGSDNAKMSIAATSLEPFLRAPGLKYDFSPVATLPQTQLIELIQSDHDDFGRFLFGFTGYCRV